MGATGRPLRCNVHLKSFLLCQDSVAPKMLKLLKSNNPKPTGLAAVVAWLAVVVGQVAVNVVQLRMAAAQVSNLHPGNL